MTDKKFLITKEYCVKILENYLQTSNEIKYVSSEVKPISDEVEGFMGEYYQLIINYELSGNRKLNRFFVKTKPMDTKEHKEIVDILGLYNKEIFIYDILLKEFKKYGFDVSFASNTYLCIPGQTLIMDDISLDGYSKVEWNKNLSMEHLKVVMEALAKYHASGFAYEDKKSKKLGRKYTLEEEYNDYLKEPFYLQYIDNTKFAMKWWIGLIKTLNVLFGLMPQDKGDELKYLLHKIDFGKSFATKTNISKICGHGDLWSNNILFKYENNIPVKCKLVDYQICRYFYPCFDVLLAIFCNTSRVFRKQYLDELYLYYHKTLAEILKNYGLNIEKLHPLEDFYKSIKLVKVEALMQMMLTIVVSNIPKDIITKRLNDGANGMNEVFFDNYGLAAEAYQKSDKYRSIMQESINELREVFLERVNNNV